MKYKNYIKYIINYKIVNARLQYLQSITIIINDLYLY